MTVEVSIIEGPLPPAATDSSTAGEMGRREMGRREMGCGAVLAFEGVVRPEEDGRQIEALEFTAYEPMATMELTKLAEDVCARHKLARITVEHSRGRVAVGETSFRLSIWSPHRKESLAAMADFIDRMKRDVPIWKKVAGE